MKKYFLNIVLLFSGIIFLSLMVGNTTQSNTNEFIGVFKSSATGQRIEISSDQKIKFFNKDNDEMGSINAIDENGNRHLKINFQFLDISANTISTKGAFNCESDALFQSVKANNYQSTSGSYGKTYTEEFEDKQGNLRTKVYENGLLVSYKINGIEQ